MKMNKNSVLRYLLGIFVMLGFVACMDDDDFRRGKESCHKKFGETFGVLAGDALLTYAFQIASDASVSPEVAVRCIRFLSNYSGIYGMVGGQTMDVQNENRSDLR